MRTPLQIFILAGGRSSRMGRDKSRLLLGSKTFLQRIIATTRELDLPTEVVTQDDVPGLGPIGGVATAFARSDCARALFLSCDMPLVSADVLRKFVDAKELFTVENGLAGFPFVVPRSVEKRLRKLRSVQDLWAEAQHSAYKPAPDDRWQFTNVNTPADYAAVEQVWREKHGSRAVLEVRHLTVRRGPTSIISNLSWQVQTGEHWVVLGANGCGKTTLFSALLGYLSPTKGDIFLMGQEYGDSDWPALRKKIGLVSSSIRQMMPDAEPAWITVASGKYAMIDFWGTPGRKDKRQALTLLRESECDYIAERPWAVLSQGERQRVLIARALMAEPALLILDEPCAGLDPAARERFLEYIQRLGSRRQAPHLVLVTHHVEEIMPVFTHAMLLKAGAKATEGKVNQVLTSRRLSEAFETAMTVRKIGGRYTLKVQASAPIN